MDTNQQQQQQQPQSPVLPPTTTTPTTTTAMYPSQPQYHHLLQQQQQQLQMFWSYQRQEIEQANDFKNHQLPLARIKKIMKADEDVRMISAEAPILFAKACELFILELTIRSWLHAEENKRRTLQKNDIAAAITRTDIFDFLVDIVPREEIKEEGLGGIMMPAGVVAGAGVVGAAVGGVPYYYPPMGQVGVGGGVVVGQAVGGGAVGGIYGPPPSQAWQSVWQNGGGGVGVVPGGDVGFGSGVGGGNDGNGGQGNLDGQSDTHWT